MTPKQQEMGKRMSDIDHVQAAAYAACCAVSPSNPLGVAAAIPDMDKLLALAADRLNVSQRMVDMELGEKITEFRRAYLARMEKRQ